jgi:[ribosomal protein S18]-alanine N-acetyltransferase
MAERSSSRDSDAAWADPPAGWTVEALEESDLDDVLEVERASFSNPWTRQMFIWEMQNAGVSYAYVLRTPQWRVAGFCTVWLVLDEVHINNVAIRPECRGQGAGRVLLTFVLREGAAHGAGRATLEVRRSNAAALKLYGALGFTIGGTRRNYYTSPVEDALILWKDHLPAAAPSTDRGAP